MTRSRDAGGATAASAVGLRAPQAWRVSDVLRLRDARHARCNLVSRLLILSAHRRYDQMDETRSPGTAGGAGADAEDDNRFGRAKQYVGDKYESASGAVRDGYNAMREKVDDVDFGAITDQVRTYVRSNPGKALLISVGVGFLIGLLLRRDEE